MPKRLLALAFLLLAPCALANTPGKHTVTYTWTDATCDASITCSYSLYRGAATGVCNGTPAPYASNFIGATYTDPTPLVGVNVAAVTATDPTTGGESACSVEVQATVPSINTKVPANPQGKVN